MCLKVQLGHVDFYKGGDCALLATSRFPLEFTRTLLGTPHFCGAALKSRQESEVYYLSVVHGTHHIWIGVGKQVSAGASPDGISNILHNGDIYFLFFDSRNGGHRSRPFHHERNL